jgi:hypothetical protein
LFDDVHHALDYLTHDEIPPHCRARPTASASIYFAFGDASGTGFGVSISEQGDSGINYGLGSWHPTVKIKVSNFWELLNFVLKLVHA